MRRGFSEDRADRWFRRVFSADQSPDRRLRPWSPIVLVRIVLIATILVALQFEEIERSLAASALLVAAIAAQPLIASVDRPLERTWRLLFAADLAFSTAISLVAPEIAANHVLLVAGLIGAAATCHHVRGFVGFVVAGGASAGIVMVNAGIGQPAQAVVAVVIVGAGFGSWMLRSRMIAASAERDRRRAVDAAGGVFVAGEVGDPVLRCVGDVGTLLGNPAAKGRINLLTDVHPDDVAGYWIPTDDLADGSEIDRTARFRTAGGGWKWIREVSRIRERGGVLELSGIMLDHTDHLDGLHQARTEATTDSLTGLANRRVLVRLLDREPEPGRHLALLDLDSFKQVNDTLGHEAGDELLRVVARRVAARIRPSDLLVRLGGDEFAIVIGDGSTTSDAHGLVNRILVSVSEPIGLHGVDVSTSASAGIVREDADNTGSTSMLRRADVAMYEAKRLGNSAVVYAPDLDERLGRRSQLMMDLPGALVCHDLRLYFQPIHTVDGRHVVGAEGLARWSHPVQGFLTPADFLELILMSSQQATFTRAMVSDAMSMVQRIGPLVDVAVNIPMNTLEDPAFVAWCFAECTRRSVDAHRLVFETSELDAHRESRTSSAIAELTGGGISISIDDFGTGHSTFERLRWGAVSHLKLDHRIVQGADANQRDATILRNVVAMAKELGYLVVGEGVETERQRAMLEAFGVDLVQGYLFSPALPADEFIAYVAANELPAPSSFEAHLVDRV